MDVWYSSKETWHTQIEHTQIIGWKHKVLSTHISMCRKEDLPKLILKGKNSG